MNFTPKTDQELKTMNLIDPGIYDYEVLEALDTISKNSGNDMIELKIKIWDSNGHERIIFDYLLESMAHKLKHFSSANGLLDKYNQGTLKDSDCIGKCGKLELIIQKDKTGKYGDRNSVKDYIEDINHKQSTLMPLTKSMQDFKDSTLDDLPF